MNTTKNKSIFFILDDFSGGGAARVISLIGSELQRRGYPVTFIMDTTRPCVYDFDPRIKVESLYGGKVYGSLNRILRAAKRIRKLLKCEDSVWISVLPSMSLSLWIASWGKKVRRVASDHTSFDRKLSFFARMIRSKIYARFDAVTILTHTDYNYLGKKLPRKIVIPNPIELDTYPSFQGREEIVLAAGRLDVWYEKGFDILIKAWAKVSDSCPGWRLHIAGHGKKESFQYLQDLITDLKIEHSVKLIGYQSDIKKTMRKASIFVLSSRVEGFGLVLLEAMSQGCACISFNCGGRQREIVQTPEEGIIIEKYDVDELAQKLLYLMHHPETIEKLSQMGIKRSQDFNVISITDKWETMINSI